MGVSICSFPPMGPRTKDHPGNCSAAIGTAILCSYLDLKNDFSPFNKNEPSREHYESNEKFKELSFDVWWQFASQLILHARLVIPNDPHYSKLQELVKENAPTMPLPTNTGQTAVVATPAVATPNKARRSRTTPKTPNRKTAKSMPKSISVAKFQSVSIDDIFLAVYEDKRIFVRVDLDGDVRDPSAHKIEISPCGTMLSYSSRVPNLMLDANALLPDADDSYLFKNLLKTEIAKRKETLKAMSDHFELRKSANLPYPVVQAYFGPDGNELVTYEIVLTKGGACFARFMLHPIGWSMD